VKNLLLLLLALALYACGETPNDGDSESVTADGDVVDLEDNPAATLTATTEAVQSAGGDITALPAGAAVDNIDTWMEALDDVDGAGMITGNLEMLKETLGESPINGAKAGMILTTLAEDTRKVAGSTPGISQLASALKAGGDKLTAGAAYQGDDLLSQTLQAGKSKMGDLTTLAPATAVSNIDGWIAKLSGMDGTEDMVEELNTLKMELGKPSIDGSKVSDILMDLSEETRDMGDGNAGLETLAYLLEAGAWRLKEM
jgi:hypothetical protein